MESSGVWALLEIEDKKVRPVSYELLTEGRKLAEKLRTEFSAVLLGPGLDEVIEKSIEELSYYGLGNIYVARAEDLMDCDNKNGSRIFCQLIKTFTPRVVLCSATPLGNDLASRVAAGLKTGLVTDCTLIEAENTGNIKATKPIHGDKLAGIYTFPFKFPQMATFRPGLIDPDPKPAVEEKRPEIINVEIQFKMDHSAVKFIEFQKGDPGTIDLGEAEVIVAGGKGIGGKEGVALLNQLADLIGGSMGGSRVAVDKGWLPLKRQIGQTGKRVSPRLFIAMGISGATQFQIGMKDSKKVISINTQKNAPIFKISDLRIVGDLHQIIPEAIKRIKTIGEQERK